MITTPIISSQVMVYSREFHNMNTTFAQIDGSGKVVDIRVVKKEFMESNPGLYLGTWIETFYTEENNPRRRPAQIGGSYDAERDIFISKKPFPSWIFDEQTQDWKAPVSEPTLKYKNKVYISATEWYFKDLAEEGIYDPTWIWDETALQWKPYGDHY